MKNFIYFCCSTDSDFQQQKSYVCQHLAKIGLDMADIDSIVTGRISGNHPNPKRKLAWLLSRCKQGDTIFISELSRLGLNLNDLFDIVTECCERGITIVQCKDGSVGGKTVLSALSLASEIEFNNIRQRTQMGLDARREQLRKHGSWISNSGRVCTHFGREKGCDMRPAVLAAAQKRQDELILWKEQSEGYKWAMKQYMSGMPRKEIVDKFNDYCEKGSPGFCTRSGGKLTAAILSKWVSDYRNNLIIV